MGDESTHTETEIFKSKGEWESKGAKRTLPRRGKRRKLRFYNFSFCLEFVRQACYSVSKKSQMICVHKWYNKRLI